MADRMRCPKCGGTDRLSLSETHEEHGSTDYGAIRIDALGSLVPPSDFWFEAGETVRVWIDCASCGHEWRPRRQSIASR